jgi:GH18 family chitinase
MVNTMLTLGFNGIDIDYEWNAVQPGTTESMSLTPARAQGYQQLLQAIRARLNKIQPQNDATYYKVTSAVFSGPDKVAEFAANGGDWKQVAAAVDFLSVMTYDMHGQFDLGANPPDNITGFHSGMRTGHNYQSNDINHYNVVDAIAAYKEQGVAENKIVMGIPAYTRIEKTQIPVTDANKGLYLTLATDQPAGESGSGGTTDYKCIVNNTYCWNGFSFNRSSLVYMKAVLSGETPEAAARTPWAYDKSLNWFMSFDDVDSSKYKVSWARENNLRGVMIWEIDGDIPLTDSLYRQNSIIYNAWLAWR